MAMATTPETVGIPAVGWIYRMTTFKKKLFEFSKSIGFRPVGLDIETSANSVKLGGKILSIGCYDPIEDLQFYKEIRYKELMVQPEAMRINGMDITKCDHKDNMNLKSCDIELRKWLGNEKAIPVGWNVGTYDMRFLREEMPKTFNTLGHRSIDLNALCFMTALKNDIGWKAVKKNMKRYSGEILSKIFQGESWCHEHNALYDAYEAIVILYGFMYGGSGRELIRDN